jgi:hypothetical protein
MLRLDNRELGVYAQYLALSLVFLISVGIPICVRRWKSRRSKDWPVAAGVFVDGNVVCSPSTQYRYPKIKINFSYRASDRRFDGHYEEGFNTYDEAAHMLESLKNGPFFVRYDPRNPAKYVLDPYRDVRESRDNT